MFINNVQGIPYGLSRLYLLAYVSRYLRMFKAQLRRNFFRQKLDVPKMSPSRIKYLPSYMFTRSIEFGQKICLVQ